MKKTKFIITIIGAFLFSQISFAQNLTDEITPETYTDTFLENNLLEKINEYRKGNNLNELMNDDILYSAAKDQADFMVKIQKVQLEQNKASRKTTIKRVKYFGGSGNSVEEVVVNLPYAKSKEFFSYEKILNDVMEKIIKSKKFNIMLLNKDYEYIGIGITMDSTGKKLYFSIVLGTTASVTGK